MLLPKEVTVCPMVVVFLIMLEFTGIDLPDKEYENPVMELLDIGTVEFMRIVVLGLETLALTDFSTDLLL
jgi:hypothetical protein